MKIFPFKLINFKLRRYLAMRKGWEPNWENYKQWLKDRKYKNTKRRLKEEAERERKAHNDKVLRQYGLGPKQQESKKWWE